MSRAGLYRIVAAGREVADEAPAFAVTPDLRETDDLEALTPEQIDEQLGWRAAHLKAANDGAAFSGGERLRGEWTGWLLVLLLAMVVAGRLNKQIAADLGISEITVKAHRGKVMRKMKARSLPELVKMAARLPGNPGEER